MFPQIKSLLLGQLASVGRCRNMPSPAGACGVPQDPLPSNTGYYQAVPRHPSKHGANMASSGPGSVATVRNCHCWRVSRETETNGHSGSVLAAQDRSHDGDARQVGRSRLPSSSLPGVTSTSRRPVMYLARTSASDSGQVDSLNVWLARRLLDDHYRGHSTPRRLRLRERLSGQAHDARRQDHQIYEGTNQIQHFSS